MATPAMNTLKMNNNRFQIHWYDKDVRKLMDRYDLQDPSAQNCLDRAASLAQAAFQSRISLIILADFQSFRVKSAEALTPESLEKLFDLAHLLKEVEPELWHTFSEQPFFRHSEFWEPIREFRFFSCQPIRTESGQILGWLCLFDSRQRLPDPGLLHILETMAGMVMDELELRVQIKKSNRIQNEIIHLAAHDLKNPLSGILGITDHIKKQVHDSGQLDEICDLIKDSSRRMLHILDDILKSGYLENGKIQLKVRPVRFEEIIRMVVKTNQPAAIRKDQQFALEVSSEPVALLDPARMEELLDNLVSNAVKFAPRGSEIRIHCWESEQDVYFSIFNPGVGLSEEDKSKIFHKFSRLSAKPTGGESSTGLGLSIVKMLTEMHGGSIEAESDGIDKGVRFVLRLPAARMVA
jgi:signal transduction histidine kinase